MKNGKILIAATGDLHYKDTPKEEIRQMFQEISQLADYLIICGDLTDSGQIHQAEVLLSDAKYITIPTAAVLGNHDYENRKPKEIKKLLTDNKINVLDGDTYVSESVGFVGVKGFMGGFDNHVLASWGEDMIKKFVYETINETLKLERALSMLETKYKIVLLHYAPIHKTVEGEHPEIIPYCGSSRLVEPIDEFNVNAVFHCHAHHGSPKGKTAKGIPVYNVSYPLLKRLTPEKPYVIFEI